MPNNQITTASTPSEVLNKSLEAPAIDPIMLMIANDHIAGLSIDEISDKYKVTQDRVVAVLDRKEVSKYIDKQFAQQGFVHRMKRMQLINRVIEEKIMEAEDSEVWTKKDLLDWLKLAKEEETSLMPKKDGPAVAVQVNNFDKLMDELT